MKQRMSKRGREFLAREEGLVPYAYADPIGLATFGVGHLIQPRHTGVTFWDKVRYGTPQSPRRRKALRVFKRDLKIYEKAVRKAVGRTLPQHKFDALVSLCFNIGVVGFSTSTVAKRVREKEGAHLVSEGFLMWDNPSILRPRRNREVRLYVTGLYTA